MHETNEFPGACDEDKRGSEKFGTDWKGRREEKQRKEIEKGALDVKFEGMAGGSGCGKSGGRIAGDSFKQGLAGHDRPSQQILSKNKVFPTNEGRLNSQNRRKEMMLHAATCSETIGVYLYATSIILSRQIHE